MDPFQLVLLLQELVEFSLHLMSMALLQLWPITKRLYLALIFNKFC